MAKYLLKASYTPEGAKGVISAGGTARRNAAEGAVRSVGGSLESFYFSFGETDAYLVVDMPDNVSAAAVSLVVNSAGAVGITTLPLLTPEEVDEAAKKSVEYTPPGG